VIMYGLLVMDLDDGVVLDDSGAAPACPLWS